MLLKFLSFTLLIYKYKNHRHRLTGSEGVVIIGPEPNSGLIIKYLLPPKGTAKHKSSLSDVSNTSLKLWRMPLDNVININGTVEGINELLNSGYGEAEFDTSRSPLQYEALLNNGRTIKSELNKYAIYRTDTGACLGDHGLKYKVVDHKDMIDSARRILQKSTLNLDGIQETITVGDGGSVCFVKHLLPEHTITTPDGDEGELTFLAVNSYNSKMAYWQSVGILQSACTNGQVFTRGAASVYKNRHTKSLSLDRAAAIISNIVGILHEENEIWHKWADTPTNSKEAYPEITPLTFNKDLAYMAGRVRAMEYIRELYANNDEAGLMRLFDAKYDPTIPEQKMIAEKYL